MRRSFSVIVGLLLLGTSIGMAQNSQFRPAVPLEPISAIIDAFKTHRIVALGEGAHGNEQGHAFRLALIRDPRFAAIVNDLVVESGNARYQDVMDRYVNGDAVSREALRRVWEDTTVPGTTWDRPIYEEFYRTVREVNARLAPARRLRVLLGDPPIDWSAVRSPGDVLGWQKQRDRYPADVVRREVVAKNVVLSSSTAMGTLCARNRALSSTLSRAITPSEFSRS
jgi:erythromycin esterase-like protein